jgi:hypothetical protein
MSKELIERLAKDAKLIEIHHQHVTPDYLRRLEAFAKAYQAAAPIDNVAEALERLVKLKLYKDKNGKDEYYEKEQPEAWLEAIRVLMRRSVATGEITGAVIPTQANRTEG